MLLGFILLWWGSRAGAVSYPLVNGGFEGTGVPATECTNITGNVAPGWNDNTCWHPARPVIRYALDTALAHAGSTAQKITLVSGPLVQFVQYLAPPLQADTRYEVTLRLRSDTPMLVHVLLRQADAPYTNYVGQLVRATAQWSEIRFDGVVDAGAAMLIITTEQVGTFWLDTATIDSSPAPAPALAPPLTPIPRQYFGLHFNRLDTPWPQVADRVGTIRVWDAGSNADGSGTGAQWAEINPAAGQFDWSGLDARVSAAGARQADVLYTLGGRTPAWASARPSAYSPYGDGQCAEPASSTLWQDWVRAVAQRYRGRIRYWEIWNEPDLPDFYCGSPETLIALASQAYAVLKQVDPANQVVAPGFSGFPGTAYFEFFYAHGGGQFVDITNHHFYADLPEDNLGVSMLNRRAILQRHGQAAKPFWNTEQGWIASPPAPLPGATGAAYVARSHLSHWAAGIGRYYYYTWDNGANQFPFVGADRVTLAEAGRAYREVAQWMTGTVMESLSRDAAGFHVATLRKGQYRRERALWRPGGNAVINIPAEWRSAASQNLDGLRASFTGGSVTVGPSPILLLSDFDGDGLLDRVEDALGTGVEDIDSDDDGVADGVEDINHDGVTQLSETSPLLADSDSDGLLDGTELGISQPLADPDGSGPLRATDPAVFVADAAPASRTDPRAADTDGDGFSDGQEDLNRNGRLDAGESDPTLSTSTPVTRQVPSLPGWGLAILGALLSALYARRMRGLKGA